MPDSIERQRVIRSNAASTPIVKPPGARNSPFDTGGAAPGRRQGSSPTDVTQLTIHQNRPIPEITRQPGGGYAGLYERMKPGDSVDLAKRQTTAFKSWAKRTGVTVIVRKLSADTWGVWKPTAQQLAEHRDDAAPRRRRAGGKGAA